MRIAVIGTGSVGTALAGRFRRAGHDVTIGSRRPGAPSPIAEVAVEPIADAARNAELVALAVPTGSLDDVCSTVGDLEGRIVVDPTNPVGQASPGGQPSNAAYVAGRLPTAAVVKAFNTVGAEILREPSFPGGAPVLPVCGDDERAVQAVAGLARACGFDPLVLGGLDSAPIQEAFARFWITLAMRGDLGRSFAFGLLSR